jgi:hypothetical protein
MDEIHKLFLKSTWFEELLKNENMLLVYFGLRCQSSLYTPRLDPLVAQIQACCHEYLAEL